MGTQLHSYWPRNSGGYLWAKDGTCKTKPYFVYCFGEHLLVNLNVSKDVPLAELSTQWRCYICSRTAHICHRCFTSPKRTKQTISARVGTISSMSGRHFFSCLNLGSLQGKYMITWTLAHASQREAHNDAICHQNSWLFGSLNIGTELP